MLIMQVYPHFVDNLELFKDSKNRYNYYAEQLVKDGYEVEQCIIGKENSRTPTDKGYDIVSFSGRKIKLVYEYFYSPRLLRYIKENKRAMVHTHNVSFTNYFVANAYRGDDFFISNLGELSYFMNPMNSMVGYQLNKGTSIFMLDSNAKMAKNLYKCDNINIVKNSIDPTVFKRKRRIKEGLLYVGRNHPDKAINLLLTYKGKASLYVVGEGFNNRIQWWDNDHGTPYLSSWKDNIYGNIESSNRLCELYNESKLLLLPSVKEGMPTVMLEAAACGIPTLGCTDCKGVVETIKEIGAGYSSKRSSYFETLESLLEKKIPKVKLPKEFTHKETYKQLKEIYFGGEV